MMRGILRAVATITSLSLLVVSCDGGGGEDAGTDALVPRDAGTDAFVPPDSGPPDAGTDAGSDAGMADAGPPTPTVTAMAVESELTTVLEMRDGIPMDMRLDDGAFATLDLAAAGIDAIIGEDGLGALSLSDAAVRAFADVHQANLLLDALQAVLDAWIESVDPSIVALRDQVVRLRDALTAYRDSVARLLVERRDAGIPGAPVIRDEHTVVAYGYGTGVPAVVALTAEGRSSGAPDSALHVECQFGSPELSVRVLDQLTGAELASGGTGSSSADVTIPLTFDETSFLAIELVGGNVGPMGEYLPCDIALTTRLRLRTAPKPVGAFDTAWASAQARFDGALFDVGNAVDTLRMGTALDPSVLDAVTRHASLVANLMGPLTPPYLEEVPVETEERIRRQLVYVRAMNDRLVASPQLAAPEAAGLRTSLAAMLDEADSILMVLALIGSS